MVFGELGTLPFTDSRVWSSSHLFIFSKTKKHGAVTALDGQLDNAVESGKGDLSSQDHVQQDVLIRLCGIRR